MEDYLQDWMTDTKQNLSHNHGCYKDNASAVFHTVTLTVACIGLPLNLVAIFAVYLLIRKDHTTPLYIINLLISDLTQFCCMVVKAEVSGETICDVLRYIFEMGLAVSIGFMVLISLERYLVIAQPLWYKFRRNIKLSVVVCVVVWVLPLLCFPIYFFAPEYIEILVACFLLLPFPLLLFFLIGTIRALSAARSIPDDEKRRILALLVTVLLLYTLLSVPRVIYSVARKSRSQFMFGIWTVIPVYFSPLADLVLYVFMKKGIADSFLVFLCRCKTDRDDVSTSKERGDDTHTDVSL